MRTSEDPSQLLAAPYPSPTLTLWLPPKHQKVSFSELTIGVIIMKIVHMKKQNIEMKLCAETGLAKQNISEVSPTQLFILSRLTLNL